MTTASTSAPVSFDRSRQMLDASSRLTPGGVHSNVRLAEQPFPLFFDSADGAHIRDVDGTDRIDYVLGMGPMILGHRPQVVIDAVVRQLGRGILYAGQHELEIAVAQRVADRVPCAEQVRFNVTGTEAVQAALRLARAATGRQRVLKFQGHYDGWADSVLANIARRGEPRDDGGYAAVSETLGAEEAVLGDLVIAEYNDLPGVEEIFKAHGQSLAAVVLEPVMANSGVIPPADGFLQRIRELCSAHGTILIFDEVITGFRVAAGGAQARFGVTPDIATFGKAIASGFPVACIAGRRELFDPISDGRIMHAGTFNASPVGLAAAVATLDALGDPDAGVYDVLERRGSRLQSGLEEVVRAHHTPILIQGLPMLFSLAFTDADRIRGHADAVQADAVALRRFLGLLVAEGVRIAAKGLWFLSVAHTDDDVDRTVDAVDRALTAFERG